MILSLLNFFPTHFSSFSPHLSRSHSQSLSLSPPTPSLSLALASRIYDAFERVTPPIRPRPPSVDDELCAYFNPLAPSLSLRRFEYLRRLREGDAPNQATALSVDEELCASFNSLTRVYRYPFQFQSPHFILSIVLPIPQDCVPIHSVPVHGVSPHFILSLQDGVPV